MARLLLLILLLSTSLAAHQIEQFYSKWTGDHTLDIQFDAGYANPLTRDDPDAPPPTRDWLANRSQEEWQQLRSEALKYLTQYLTIEQEGHELPLSAYTFPDWDHHPPAFPQILNGFAYFTIRITPDPQGPLTILLTKTLPNAENIPNLIINDNNHYTTLYPGDEHTIPAPNSTSSLESKNPPTLFQSLRHWTTQGYRHVIPEGYDHLLFMIGLFFYRREWKWLLGQSLLFTLAHAITFGLVSLGLINFNPAQKTIVETLILLSITYVGLETIRGKPFGGEKGRLILTFIFGLIHGIGFSTVLLPYLDQDQWLPSLASLNLGIELAQITALAALWLITLAIWQKKQLYRRLQHTIGIFITATALFWLIQSLS